MLRKKLLTVTCVAGILLIGACFDVRRQMIAVHTIGVEVTDESSEHELNVVQLRDALVTQINNPQMHSHLYAIKGDGGGNVDATLTISIRRCEDTDRETRSAQIGQIHLECNLSIILTRKSGASMWKASQYRAFGYIDRRPQTDSADGSSEIERRRKAMAEEIASGITRDLLYSHTADW